MVSSEPRGGDRRRGRGGGRHASADQLLPRGLDVGDDQVRAAHRPAWGVVVDADAERDGGCRAGRRALHHAELVVGLVVDVEVEAALVGVEGLGAVDVGDWQQDEFELEVHGSVLGMVGATLHHVKRAGTRKLIGAAIASRRARQSRPARGRFTHDRVRPRMMAGGIGGVAGMIAASGDESDATAASAGQERTRKVSR